MLLVGYLAVYLNIRVFYWNLCCNPLDMPALIGTVINVHLRCVIYLSVGPFGFGETPRLRCSTGDLFGDLLPRSISPFSFSGDGEEPPVAEFRRDGVNRTVVSKWRNLLKEKMNESNEECKKCIRKCGWLTGWEHCFWVHLRNSQTKMLTANWSMMWLHRCMG